MRKPPALTSNWLDNHQYTTDSILHYEKVFGDGFVSPGGRPLSSKLIGNLSLTPGTHVLADVHAIDKLDVTDDVKQSLNMSWQSKLERARGWDH